MLDNAIVVANGKGGVGKTSLVANMAAIAAQSGWNVLAVDLDVQANLGMDLGYGIHKQGDQGRSLATALVARLRAAVPYPEVEPLRSVRPNLDVITAGRHTAVAAEAAGAAVAYRSNSIDALRQVLEVIAHRYDLILIDTPPSGTSVLAKHGLVASTGLVIPIRADAASLDGVELLSEHVGEIRRNGLNPGLELTGIVMFDFATNESAIKAETEHELIRLFGSEAPIIRPPIRRSTRAAVDMRRDGQTALDYEAAQKEEQDERLSSLRSRNPIRGRQRAKAAPKLADDYMAVTRQILANFGAQPEEDTSLQPDPWVEGISA